MKKNISSGCKYIPSMLNIFDLADYVINAVFIVVNVALMAVNSVLMVEK